MFKQRRTVSALLATLFSVLGIVGIALPASAAAVATAPTVTTEVLARQCSQFRVDAPGNVAINVRSGPGGGKVMYTVPEGAVVVASNRVVNNYRELASPGQWAYAPYLVGPLTGWVNCPA